MPRTNDYRVKYQYPQREDGRPGNKGTLQQGELTGANVEARRVAYHGGTAQVWYVTPGTKSKEQTYQHTYSPAGVREGFDPREIGQFAFYDDEAFLTDEQIAEGASHPPVEEEAEEETIEPTPAESLPTPDPEPEATPIEKKPVTPLDVDGALHYLGARNYTVSEGDNFHEEPYVMISVADMAKILDLLPESTW